MDNLKKRLAAAVFSQKNFPAALLGLSLASYGLLIPWLGFYWDDLAFQWIAEKLGSEGLIRYFNSARPIWGLFIRADLALFGSQPWVWQLFGIFWRWVSSVMLWIFLRLLWPKRPGLAVLAALLFVVYPGFDQQYIPINYGHFFMVYSALLFSFGAMLTAVRRIGKGLIWTGLGLFFSAVNLLSMEYFFLLDLLRPVFLFVVAREGGQGLKARLKQVLTQWLPYLAVFLGVSFWRAFLFKNQTLGNQPKLLGRLAANPIQTGLELANTILNDLTQALILAWSEAFRIPEIPAIGMKVAGVSLMLALGVGLAMFFYLRRLGFDGMDQSEGGRLGGPAVVSIAALLIAGWPFWLTLLVVGLRQPNSRFILPFVFGVVILVAAGLLQIPKKVRWVSFGLAAVLVGASSGYQFRVGNQYRLSQEAQRRFFWQMTWRIPEMKEGTAVLANDLPIDYVTDNSLTAMLNWIYAPENGSEKMDHFLYYPSLRGNTVLGGMQPGKPITHNYWAAVFYGNTSQVVAVQYQPPACLRVLDADVDRENPMIAILMRRSAELSSWEWIIPTPEELAAKPPEHIYGDEPYRGWCYYFEKADLARQQGDWNGVVKIAETAFSLGDYPNDPAERFPFIEGFAHTGQWETALEQTRLAAGITPLIHPSMCRLWERIAEDTPNTGPKEKALSEAAAQLGCEDL